MPTLDFNQYSEHKKGPDFTTKTHKTLLKHLKKISNTPLTLLASLQNQSTPESFAKLADPIKLSNPVSLRSKKGKR